MSFMDIFNRKPTFDDFLKAVLDGEVDTAKKLLNRGLSPNTASDNGNTLLMMSVYYGQASITELLINKGASVHQKNKRGQTALDFAKIPCADRPIDNDPRKVGRKESAKLLEAIAKL